MIHRKRLTWKSALRPWRNDCYHDGFQWANTDKNLILSYWMTCSSAHSPIWHHIQNVLWEDACETKSGDRTSRVLYISSTDYRLPQILKVIDKKTKTSNMQDRHKLWTFSDVTFTHHGHEDIITCETLHRCLLQNNTVLQVFVSPDKLLFSLF